MAMRMGEKSETDLSRSIGRRHRRARQLTTHGIDGCSIAAPSYSSILRGCAAGGQAVSRSNQSVVHGHSSRGVARDRSRFPVIPPSILGGFVALIGTPYVTFRRNPVPDLQFSPGVTADDLESRPDRLRLGSQNHGPIPFTRGIRHRPSAVMHRRGRHYS